MIREIVKIDEEKCDGCGLCVPACHEGAIKIIDGKARLVSDRLCDGLGACLGHCPNGAITVQRRDADAFDEALVAANTEAICTAEHVRPASPATAAHSGCPGSRTMQFLRSANPQNSAVDQDAANESALTHWPVQLNLLPPHAPVLQGARLLIAADCVPVAYGDFHRKLLRGRAVLIGCPKFDDVSAYVEKLATIIRLNDLMEIAVARMEVPCCTGLVTAVLEARRRAGVSVRVRETVISTRGDVLSEREVPAEVAA